MNVGYISLHRKIMNHPDYFAEPFTRIQAWMDLLLIANHSEGRIYKRGNLIIINRGEVGYSKERLADRWQWNRKKVTKFLDRLELDGQIVQEMGQQNAQQKNRLLSKILIVNYDEYQRNGTTEYTTEGQQKVQQKDTNNNDNNDKNEKEIKIAPKKKPLKKSYGELSNVNLSDIEYEKLKDKLKGSLPDYIDRLSLYISSKGEKYKSHYATILVWFKKDIEEGKLTIQPKIDCIFGCNGKPKKLILDNGEDSATCKHFKTKEDLNIWLRSVMAKEVTGVK